MIALTKTKAALEFSKDLYTREGLEAAALVLGARARVGLEEERGRFLVELKPAKGGDARILAGVFADEALSHSCRQDVIAFHRPLSQAVLARWLTEGYPAMRADPLEQLEPQVREDRLKETQDLLDEARRLGG